MAAATTLVLKNNADVNVNYYPVVIKTGEYAQYVDRSQGVLALQPIASLTYRDDSQNRKVSGKVTFPVKDATTSVVTIAFGTFEMKLPKVQSAADRADLRKRLAALVSDAIVAAAVDNGETPW